VSLKFYLQKDTKEERRRVGRENANKKYEDWWA